MSVADRARALAHAQLIAERATAIAEDHRRALDEEFSRRAKAGTWATEKIPDLVSVRLDPPRPSAKVTDPDAVAEFVADHRPDEVLATLTVTASDLPAAVAALEFAGVSHTRHVEVRPAYLKAFLSGLHLEDDRTATHVDDATGEARTVPGVKVDPGRPRFVATLAPGLKTQARKDGVRGTLTGLRSAVAALEAAPAGPTVPVPPPTTTPDTAGVDLPGGVPGAQVLTGLDDVTPTPPPPPPPPPPAGPPPTWATADDGIIDADVVPDGTDEIPLDALAVSELRRICRARGLNAGGNKADLVEKLTASAFALHTPTPGHLT